MRTDAVIFPPLTGNQPSAVKAPVRVAQVIGRYKAGGVEAVVMNYYRHIDRTKIQFDFIMDGFETTPLDGEIIGLGGRVYKVTPYTRNMLRSMWDYYRIFQRNQYPIVHSHMNTLSIFPLMAAKMAGVKVRIAHNHSTAAWGEPKTLIKYLLRPFARVFPTHYFACSRYAGAWLFGEKRMRQSRATIMPNAIDVEQYSYKPDVRQKVRKDLGISDQLVIGHVGRFVYQKNHAFLIDIFQQVHRQKPDSVLMLVGTGELEPTVRQKVERLGLANAVMFMGVRQDVPELLQAMDAFVLPSFYEGLPVVGVEAQAAGLPCILSDVITQEVKITDLVAFLSLSQSPGEWSKKILSYVNSFQRKEMNREIEESGFEISSTANTLLDQYSIISGNCHV